MTVPTIHLGDIQKRSRIFTVLERKRNSKEIHWFIECFAEAMGVFLYVYFGIGSQIAFVFGGITKTEGLSSVLQIGLAYSFGILFAIFVCAGSSGGHFNPCITIAMVIFKGFPKLKAARYIVAQILGAYIAALVVYTQWGALIEISDKVLMSAGSATYAATKFSPNGAPGAFANYMIHFQTIPRAFMNEFVNSFVVALVIWGCLDPGNSMVPPPTVPFVISFAYAGVIWGYSIPAVSLNTARDLGARLAAMTIWGTEAAGTSYSAISALVNIPATLLAVVVYEVFFVDSDRVIDAHHLEFLRVHSKHRRLGNAAHNNPDGTTTFTDVGSASSREKAQVSTYENAPGGNSHV